jgi:hypothetical protein
VFHFSVLSSQGWTLEAGSALDRTNGNQWLAAGLIKATQVGHFVTTTKTNNESIQAMWSTKGTRRPAMNLASTEGARQSQHALAWLGFRILCVGWLVTLFPIPSSPCLAFFLSPTLAIVNPFLSWNSFPHPTSYHQRALNALTVPSVKYQVLAFAPPICCHQRAFLSAFTLPIVM